MEVIVISDTIQEFLGERYYLCGFYFQKRGKRLHRTVWETLNGSIPKGYHVHHVDGDRSNNQPQNLQLMLGTDHLSEHMADPARKEMGRSHLPKARDGAAAWHRSEEGRKWHAKHARESGAVSIQTKVTKTCEVCGAEYDALLLQSTTSRFCSNACKSAFRRASGVDNETRNCAACGAEFQANKYAKIKTCSLKCGWVVRKAAKLLPSGQQV